MATKPRIALIGGGIGGLTAAIALRRCGFEPVVFEQASELKEVGAGIQITPNSTKILRAIGLEDAVRKQGFEPGFMLTRDMTSGEILFRTPAKGAMAERFGAGWFQIHRADLLEILTSALAGAAIRLNARCVGVEPVENGAVVQISGSERELFDVVVGCDGILSMVRTILHGDQNARFTGNMCWRAMIPVNALPENHLEPVMNYWMGRRGHVVAYFVRGGALVNLVAVLETDRWVEESWAVEGLREDLLSAFPKAHRDLRILLERVERCFKWGLFDRDPSRIGAEAGLRCWGMPLIQCCHSCRRVRRQQSRMAMCLRANLRAPRLIPMPRLPPMKPSGGRAQPASSLRHERKVRFSICIRHGRASSAPCASTASRNQGRIC
jgi:salicylate hydroxylase